MDWLCTTSLWPSSASSCASTITPSQRRSKRRGRAIARRQWFLFKRGWITLNRHQLQKIYVTLDKHHSRDPQHLAKILDKMELQPWKCQCGRLNKKVARTCASCHWGYAPMPQDWHWGQQSWPHWDQRQQVKHKEPAV